MPGKTSTNRNGQRPPQDLYDTPDGTTRAFLDRERVAVEHALWIGECRGCVWEPASGRGFLSRVLAEKYRVVETDLRPRRGVKKLDFMTARRLLSRVIITNPPYNVGKAGGDFVRHALSLEPVYAAFLLELGFQTSGGRKDLLEGEIGGLRLARIYVNADRLTMSPPHLELSKGGAMDFNWMVWSRHHSGPPTWHRIYAGEHGKKSIAA